MRARYDDGGPPDPPEHPSIAIIDQILAARDRDRELQGTVLGKPAESTLTREQWMLAILENVVLASLNPDVFSVKLYKAAVLILGVLEADALGDFDPPPTPEEPDS